MLFFYLLLSLVGFVTSQYDSSEAPVFSSCGSDITVDKGVITSPEYPGDYPNNLMCRWRVLPQVDGMQIRVLVEDLQIWESYICAEDFVRLIFQGADSRSYRLCGNDPQKTRNATHFGPLEVYMQTNKYNVSKGFRLKFEVLSPCLSDPCQNGGSCNYDNTSYTCQCSSGWEGINCENEINECRSDPCQNGGTCTDDVNRFTCLCPSGVTGDICDVINDRCAFLRPCANGGTCENMGDTYVCTCAVGYTGKDCDAESNECASSPCLNGGKCTDMFARYMCECVDGYSGNNCEISPPTTTSTTTAATTTTAPTTMLTTTVVSSTQTAFCEMTSSITCLNGGSCVVVGGVSEACLCADGFEGKQCESFAKDSPDYLNALIATSAAALICILLMGAFVCLILCKRKKVSHGDVIQLTGRGQPDAGNYAANENKQQTPRKAWTERHEAEGKSNFIGHKGENGSYHYDSMLPNFVPSNHGYNPHYHGTNGYPGIRVGGKRRHSVVDGHPKVQKDDEKIPDYNFTGSFGHSHEPIMHSKRHSLYSNKQKDQRKLRDPKKNTSRKHQPTKDVKIAPDAAATLINYLSHALKRGIPDGGKMSRDKSSSDAMALRSIGSDETSNQKLPSGHVLQQIELPEKARRRNHFHSQRDVEDDAKMDNVRIYDYFDQFASDKQGRRVLKLTRENAFLFE